MVGRRRVIAAFALLAAFATAARAREIEDAADAVLAGKPLPADVDPWLVADELCVRGEREAARKLASGAVEHFAARPEARAKLRRANEARAAGDWRAVVAALTDVDTAPADLVSTRAQLLRGVGLLQLRRLDDAEGALTLAAKAARHLGWRRAEGLALTQGATVALQRGRYADAVKLLDRATVLFDAAGARRNAAINRSALGGILSALGKVDRARELLEKSAAGWHAVGDKKVESTTRGLLASLHEKQGRLDAAAAEAGRAVALAREGGHTREEGVALSQLGGLAAGRGDFPAALEHYRDAHRLLVAAGAKQVAAEARALVGFALIELGRFASAEVELLAARADCIATDHTRGVAVVDANLAALWSKQGELGKAAEAIERALALRRRVGPPRALATCLTTLASIHHRRGDHARAAATYEQARGLFERLGERLGALRATYGLLNARLHDAPAAAIPELRMLRKRFHDAGAAYDVALTTGVLALAIDTSGDQRGAVAVYRAAIRGFESLDARADAARELGNLGACLVKLSRFAEALAALEKAAALQQKIGDAGGAAITLANLASLLNTLGRHEEAVAREARALAIYERLGDQAGIAQVLQHRGARLQDAGQHKQAIALWERALAIRRARGDERSIALLLQNLGVAHVALGAFDEARAHHQESLALFRKAGDAAGAAGTLHCMGMLARKAGDAERAAELAREAIAAADEVGDMSLVLRAHLALALARHDADDGPGALAALDAGLARTPALAAGLGEAGLGLRDHWAAYFTLGAELAAKQRDAAAFLRFNESLRAGALLETLRNREALRAARIPKDLRAAEDAARGRVARARTRLAAAGGKRAAIREARAELTAARADLQRAVERIQREALAQADLLYPKPASLDEVQAGLRDGDVFVQFAAYERGKLLALVIDGKSARIALLDGAAVARAAAERDGDALRAVLGSLAGDARRVVVSPDGALALAPLCLAFPGKDVVYAPSATTYRMLAARAADAGEGVLALGDPVYGEWPPLPSSRAEAKAVGDVVLLGEDATAAKLVAALGGRPRWRAVHFACHGVLDARDPRASALVLTGDARLTVTDVFASRLDADLVVLSACETARGEVTRAEGVIGFARAFLFAGASRVVVSLWKVDDAATAALMEQFYDLWKSGRPAATALRLAQEHVRLQERWQAPRYWAAWQLWGP